MRAHPWLLFGLRRTLLLAASLAVLVVMTLLTTRLVPGDPVRGALGPTASARLVEARRASLHLDDSLLGQLRHYAGGIVRGDFGESLTGRRSVNDILGERLPATARLAALAFLVAALVALPVGIATAVASRGGRRRGLSAGFSLTTGLLVSIPEYLCAAGLVALFGVTLGWLPIAGAEQPISYGSRSWRWPPCRRRRSPASHASRRCACSTRSTCASRAASGCRRGGCTCATCCRTR